MGKLKTVAINEIRENPAALRNVNRESEEYLGLVESMKQRGFMGSITVREKADEAGNPYYEIIDGLHRFTAAKDAGIKQINIDAQDLEDAEVLEAQVLQNIHKVETRPVEYSKQLRRILSQNPMMTESELAKRLGKSPQWVKERLGLTKIENKEIANLIDEGKIPLSNAYALAKLPTEEQANYTDRAMSQGPEEFVQLANQRVKEIKDAKKQGKDPSESQFEAVAYLRKLKELRTERESHEVAKKMVKEQGIKDPVQAFTLAIDWTLHLDPVSVEEQRAKHEERQQQKEEAKKRREAEKKRKEAERKQKEAQEAADAAAKAEEG